MSNAWQPPRAGLYAPPFLLSETQPVETAHVDIVYHPSLPSRAKCAACSTAAKAPVWGPKTGPRRKTARAGITPLLTRDHKLEEYLDTYLKAAG